MELEFEEYIPVRSSKGISETIFREVVEWEYIPSIRCVRETFNVGNTTAKKVWHRLVRIKRLLMPARMKVRRKKKRDFLYRWLCNNYGIHMFACHFEQLPFSEKQMSKYLYGKPVDKMRRVEFLKHTAILTDLPDDVLIIEPKKHTKDTTSKSSVIGELPEFDLG